MNALTSVKPEPARIATLRVAPDQLEATTQDAVLVARLDATLALCFYDAVEEPGALLHLRIAPPRNTVASELTDTALAGDLLLLEQTLKTLGKVAPGARYWQCKLIAQLPDDDATLGRATACVIEFVRAFLRDSVVRVVDSQVRFGGAADVQFRPALGEVRIQQIESSDKSK